MSANEKINPIPALPTDILSLIWDQVETDYYIHCIRTGKEQIVGSILVWEGFQEDEVKVFLNEIKAHLNSDVERVSALQLSDEEAIDLAKTILRTLKG